MFSFLYNRFRRITSNQLYFPEIDGIRFLAISLVVFFHINGYFAEKTRAVYPGGAGSATWIHDFLSKGDRGVELFFVLSGFILCMPFAHQYINNGKKIILKKYYLRRVTRLEPPYILAITVIFLMQLVMKVHNGMSIGEQLQHYFASLTYTHGIIFQRTPIITVVAWSLELEIQFYVLAPIFFKILKLPGAVRRSLLVAAIIAISISQHYFMPDYLYFTIYRVLQYFLIGILLADLYVSDVAGNRLNASWVTLFSVPLLIAICVIPIKEALWGHLLIPFMVGTFYLIVMKNEAVKRIFSYGFIPIIGGMCYTIYLVHYTVISMIGRLTLKVHIPGGYVPNLLLQLSLLSPCVLVISSIYYLYVERPFMDQKWMGVFSKKRKGEEINPVKL